VYFVQFNGQPYRDKKVVGVFVRFRFAASPGLKYGFRKTRRKKLSTAEVVSWKCTSELGFINRYCF
jgi:hypothetical protein